VQVKKIRDFDNLAMLSAISSPNEPLWIFRRHQISDNHRSHRKARAGKHHYIANGRYQRDICRVEFSKQSSAEPESNERAAGSKYNQSKISHEFPRDLRAHPILLP
jgi:hypothetical protein